MDLDRETIELTDGPFYRASDGRMYHVGEGPDARPDDEPEDEEDEDE
jgi:hypothetical protein